MKNLRQMTLGKLKALCSEVFNQWMIALEPHRSADWLDEFNTSVASFTPYTAEDVFNIKIISVKLAENGHNELLDEDLDEDEVFVPLDTKDVIAFIDPSDGLPVYIPIYKSDSRLCILQKISSCCLWPDLEMGGTVGNPYLSDEPVVDEAGNAWVMGLNEKGTYTVSKKNAGIVFTFDPCEKRQERINFAGHAVSYTFDHFMLFFDNGKASIDDFENEIPIPLAVFCFIVTNSGFDQNVFDVS